LIALANNNRILYVKNVHRDDILSPNFLYVYVYVYWHLPKYRQFPSAGLVQR